MGSHSSDEDQGLLFVCPNKFGRKLTYYLIGIDIFLISNLQFLILKVTSSHLLVIIL